MARLTPGAFKTWVINFLYYCSKVSSGLKVVCININCLAEPVLCGAIMVQYYTFLSAPYLPIMA